MGRENILTTILSNHAKDVETGHILLKKTGIVQPVILTSIPILAMVFS